MRKDLLLFAAIIINGLSIAQNRLVSPTAGISAKNESLHYNKRSNSSSSSTTLNPKLKPFYHGVASGDPLSDRVIIWTRVTPDTPGIINGTWRVSSDTSMSDTVAIGSFTTDSSRDYTVKIDVSGLNSNTTYYYVFTALNANSLIGRTKTAPLSNEANHLKFGVVSCSNFEAGYFNAYARLGERNDIDAVIHLGDYIYEYPTGAYGDSTIQNSGRVHDTVETVSLAQYRSRYSLYRLDKDLRLAHQQHPFINIWDDHESANDAWENGAENHDSSEGSWAVRKAISKQAFFEWIPIRDNNQDSIYRVLNYGNLVDLIMLDTRIEGREEQINDVTNPAMYSPTRTMLGNDQKSWFLNALSNSTAKWKIIGNQVIFSEFHVGWAAQSPATPAQTESIFLDIWDGYPSERLNIINFIENNNIDDVVFLTGDFHSTFAFDVADSVTNPNLFYSPTANYNRATGAGSVAVEFATPSISSANFDENIGVQTATIFELQINNPLPTTAQNIPNPHLKYVDLDQHGYFILDVKNDSVQANWYFSSILDSSSTTETFGNSLYSKTAENHLTLSGVESPAKSVQEIPAPLLPPSFGIVGINEITNNSLQFIGIYPNPSINNSIIQFGIQKSERINVSLYDLKSKLVNELANGFMQKGIYNLTINSKAYSNGTYFIVLTSSNNRIAQKFIVAH
jgi:alkaline phosphatase D